MISDGSIDIINIFHLSSRLMDIWCDTYFISASVLEYKYEISLFGYYSKVGSYEFVFHWRIGKNVRLSCRMCAARIGKKINDFFINKIQAIKGIHKMVRKIIISNELLLKKL